MRTATIASAALLLLASTVSAANKKTDVVQGLPNVVLPLPSKWYSGYLSVTDSKALHYVLVQSLNNATTDPLLLWFNGGPGCSSMEGLFAELGPFIFDDGETFIKPNPYPWNMNASVLYIESPAGVGFSIANNTPDDYKHSDISQS
jgi:carboxypeptidase C (cathepsin A)